MYQALDQYILLIITSKTRVHCQLFTAAHDSSSNTVLVSVYKLTFQ